MLWNLSVPADLLTTNRLLWFDLSVTVFVKNKPSFRWHGNKIQILNWNYFILFDWWFRYLFWLHHFMQFFGIKGRSGVCRVLKSTHGVILAIFTTIFWTILPNITYYSRAIFRKFRFVKVKTSDFFHLIFTLFLTLAANFFDELNQNIMHTVKKAFKIFFN